MKAILVALVALAPLPASAGVFSDLAMAPGLFAEAPEGPLLAYAEERTVPGGVGLEAVENGRLLVVVEAGRDGRRMMLSREADGRRRPLADFPAGSANPVLLYFLESTARGMAAATGGSPFYIRNQMREALAAADLGAEAEPRSLALRPFEADPNRARMGVFADLVLVVRFDAEQPDRLLELSADTPAGEGGYHHRLTLSAEE